MDNSGPDDSLLRDFINESREHLADIEADLLKIEEDGANIDEELVNKVFRAAHSIKGGSAYFGFSKIKDLAHKAETVLDMLRQGKVTPNAEVTNILLAAFDKLREMVNHTDRCEQTDTSSLLESLVNLVNNYTPAGGKDPFAADAPVARLEEGQAVMLDPADIERAKEKGWHIYQLESDLIRDVEARGESLLSFFNTLTETCEIIDCVIDEEAVGSLDGQVGERLPVRLVFATVLEPYLVGALFKSIEQKQIVLLFEPFAAQVQAVIAGRPEEASVPSVRSSGGGSSVQFDSGASGGVAEDTLRVNVGLLETLMNLAGELVLSRNQLRAAVAQDNRQLLASADQRVNQVTSEIQDVIMQTRLQPIGNVFSRFPRMVRDLAQGLGKEIQLEVTGKDVALDKTLIEGLSDPLTHMVRNAVDHGIEAPEERQRAGKKPAGKLHIEARHEAGQVVVEISDDGKGIDPRRVAELAVSKGLVPADRIATMSDRDKQALIFLPGFSTAEKVTDVSGRGVGMDVVKTNLDRLGGQVEIVSEVGKGSSFRIKLPLTLAIISSLIVSVERERFAIPQANVEELLHLRPDDVRNRVEVVGDREVLLLRDRLLPLVRFTDILGIMPTYFDPGTGQREADRRVHIADRRSPRHPLSEDTDAGAAVHDEAGRHNRRIDERRQSVRSALNIAVVTTGTMSYGLVVDTFHDTEEVVVKPLGRRLKNLREYSGATILGDGAVALILDASGLALKAGLTSVSGTARALELAASAEAQRLQDVYSLLLFHNGPGEPCAVPLDLVQRIESITPDQIEELGGHRAMQYHGGSLPLVTLADAASVGSFNDDQELVVLVSEVNGYEVGVLGAMPVDVVETTARIDQSTHRQKGVSGSLIVRDRTTLIVDIHELVDAVHPEWSQERETLRAEAAAGGCVVLLAEDSDFFRAQVKKFLVEDGFCVLDAPDGEAAWELLLSNLGKVCIVVTDIEMPRLTGLELASRIRADARTAHLPIIAVTALAADEDMERGKHAGVNEYHIKLDRDRLLSSVHNLAKGGRAKNARG